jgi:hypothetical protein
MISDFDFEKKRRPEVKLYVYLMHIGTCSSIAEHHALYLSACERE